MIECPDDKQAGVRKNCGKSFRVAVYTMSAAKQAEEDERARAEDEARRKAEKAKEARASRGGLSSRYNGEEEEESEWMKELGQFIVTEDCPRCGQQFTSGHAAHLKKCGGKKGSSAEPGEASG